MKKIFSLWTPVALWAALIFFLSSLPKVGPEMDETLNFILSKTAHVMEYFVLAFLLSRALEGKFWAAVILSALYGASDEFHQSLVPLRHPSLMDVCIDSAASFLGAWAWGSQRTYAFFRSNGLKSPRSKD